MKEKIELEISAWTIAKIILVLVGIYFLFFVREIILLLFFVFILVSTFSPVVNKWEKKIKRIPSVIALVLIGLVLIGFFIYIVVPPLVDQFKQFINNLPNIVEFFKQYFSAGTVLGDNITSLTKNIGDYTSSFLSITINIFGGIFTFFMAIILTIYLLIDQKSFSEFFISIVPERKKDAAINVIKKISSKVGDWFRGQMILCLIIGVLDFIGLFAIGVPYALALAVISGVLEIIPTIGPFIAGLIAIVIALTVSPLTALLVLIFYVIIQQLENTIIVPSVMKKAVGLSPVIIIIAVLIGAKLLGFVGALVAVPVAASISVIIREWNSIRSITAK